MGSVKLGASAKTALPAPPTPVPVPLAQAAYMMLLVAAFVSTWTGVYVGPLKLVDLCLAVLCLVGVFAICFDFKPPPYWIVVGGVTAAFLLVGHRLLPTDSAYLATRFDVFGSQIAAGIIEPPPLETPFVIGVQWLVALVVVPIVVSNVIIKSGRSIEPVMLAIAYGATVCSAVAVTDFAGITNIGSNFVEFAAAAQGRQNGLASHQNNLGFTATMAMPIALWLMRRKPLRGGFILAVLLAGALLSGSRAFQIAGAIVFVGALFFIEHFRRYLIFPIAWSGAVAAVLLAIFNPGVAKNFSQVLRFDGSDSSARESDSGRTLLLQQGVEDWRHSPFYGVGFDVLNSAHNIYLQLLATGGVLLFAGIVVYWVGLIRTTRYATRQGESMAPVLLSFVALWLIAGLFENQLVDRFLFFPVGVIVTLAIMRRDQEVEAERSARAAVMAAPMVTGWVRSASSSRHRTAPAPPHTGR